MPLIGTAGHVDHGKSTLIQRLTGRDPDRWEEEKRRGLTIDLGFAWMQLPGGKEVSFVDVPGHERYLKNMLAGVEAIDAAILVVSADEGWMPQSEEHLAVLDLLEVTRGVVALTKVDMVDEDLVELARLEVSERLEGTSMGQVPIIAVSAVSGEGVDDLIHALERALQGHVTRDMGRPRLWVDRSFSVGGAGTVVTGTLLDGKLRVGDEVVIQPGGPSGRIRGIQTHERDVEAGVPGSRVALNLTGLDRREVPRGVMIGFAGHWLSTERFLASLETARYVDELEARGDYQIHIGSRAERVEVLGLSQDALVIRSGSPLPLAAGDRFILRDTGRKLVVAGGRVLDPAPGGTRAALADARRLDPENGPDALATALLALRGEDDLRRLRSHSGGGEPFQAVIVEHQALTADLLDDLRSRAIAAVESEHATHPLRVGLPMATMTETLAVTPAVAERIVDMEDRLERIGPDIALSGRQIVLEGDLIEERARVLAVLGEDLAVPNVADLTVDTELLHLMLRRGEVVRISDDLVMLPEQVERVVDAIREMNGPFTVAEFRDATGLTRKYAVPLLEWADMRGLTLRRGDSRTVR